jgi:hypothetical protein
MCCRALCFMFAASKAACHHSLYVLVFTASVVLGYVQRAACFCVHAMLLLRVLLVHPCVDVVGSGRSCSMLRLLPPLLLMSAVSCC